MSRKQQAIPSLTKPLTSSSVADALAECYKNAGLWGSRREILSIRDGSLEKLWGGGEFLSGRNFFSFFVFFWGGELSYFKCTNKLRRNSEITHVQARITHVQPTTGCSTCEEGKKTCTQFFLRHLLI